MERRQYTASTYTIDFENHSVLLTYNSKLKNGCNLVGIF